MLSVALVVSTYNQPGHLRLCLAALSRQSQKDFQLLIADDGSDDRTRAVINDFQPQFNNSIMHLWQEDQGFRKTRILNRALVSTSADYLVFMDGDCIAHQDFVREHAWNIRPGHYMNGSMIRLSARLTSQIGQADVLRGQPFRPAWLSRKTWSYDRRYLRFSLDYRTRCLLNRTTMTKLYWLGANSSCFRKDALAINGFDNRFSYGFEDGDFGNRLENLGIKPATVRWTANVLNLFHGRPYSNPEVLRQNLAMMTPKRQGGDYWVTEGATSLII